jgi:hypothetical protein
MTANQFEQASKSAKLNSRKLIREAQMLDDLF